MTVGEVTAFKLTIDLGPINNKLGWFTFLSCGVKCASFYFGIKMIEERESRECLYGFQHTNEA